MLQLPKSCHSVCAPPLGFCKGVDDTDLAKQISKRRPIQESGNQSKATALFVSSNSRKATTCSGARQPAARMSIVSASNSGSKPSKVIMAASSVFIAALRGLRLKVSELPTYLSPVDC